MSVAQFRERANASKTLKKYLAINLTDLSVAQFRERANASKTFKKYLAINLKYLTSS